MSACGCLYCKWWIHFSLIVLCLSHCIFQVHVAYVLAPTDCLPLDHSCLQALKSPGAGRKVSVCICDELCRTRGCDHVQLALNLCLCVCVCVCTVTLRHYHHQEIVVIDRGVVEQSVDYVCIMKTYTTHIAMLIEKHRICSSLILNSTPMLLLR